MNDTGPVVVFFPGAWGNKSLALVRWWFEHLIAFFEGQGFRVVLLTYQGQTLDAYTAHVLDELDRQHVPDGSYAICYSMGAQICRAVQARRHGHLFNKVILIGGLEATGVSFGAFARSLLIAWWPLVRGFFTGLVAFTNWRQVWRIMYSAKPESKAAAKEMLAHMAPEPLRVILALAFPGLRQRMTRFQCPALGIVGPADFFARQAEYPGERVNIIPAVGQAHALIRSAEVVQCLNGGIASGFDWLNAP